MDNLTLSLVIPTLNESANIESLLRELEQLVKTTPDCTITVQVVDDHSTDSTAAIVQELMATRPWLSLIVRQGPRDLSAAVVEGWRQSQSDWMMVMDGDLQHPAESWQQALPKMHSGTVDLILGSRFAEGSTLPGLS